MTKNINYIIVLINNDEKWDFGGSGVGVAWSLVGSE